jgi:predicted transcriptional regulator
MRVMYRSNLNFERFNKYFYDLLRKGFVEEMDNGNGRSLYKITGQGRTLLAVLKKAHDLANSEDDSV